jgi:maleate cis-trans isomerase
MMTRADDYQQLLEKGYGHIGRIGYLSPGIVDETLSAQWYRMAPHGVSLVRTSLELKDVTIDEVNAAVARTEKAAAELGKYRPDCIIFGGSPTVAVAGHGFDKVVVAKIEKASGRKAFSAQAAAIEALHKYGARKLALATPFPDKVNALVKDFLEKSGFEVLSIKGSGAAYVDLTLTPLRASWDLGKEVFEHAASADALYFPGAPQPCVDIIDALEKELGTLVISSLQASLWKALQIIGYDTPILGYGRLLRELG